MKQYFEWLPLDKQMHVIGGAIMAAWVGITLWITLWSYGAAMAVGCFGANIGVEIYQKVRHEGTPELGDALAGSFIGFILGVIVAWLEFTR